MLLAKQYIKKIGVFKRNDFIFVNVSVIFANMHTNIAHRKRGYYISKNCKSVSGFCDTGWLQLYIF